METQKLTITLRDWSYTCGDGCCTDYGTELLINGEVQEHPESTAEEPITGQNVGGDPVTAIAAVLRYLGVEFWIDTVYEE